MHLIVFSASCTGFYVVNRGKFRLEELGKRGKFLQIVLRLPFMILLCLSGPSSSVEVALVFYQPILTYNSAIGVVVFFYHILDF